MILKTNSGFKARMDSGGIALPLIAMTYAATLSLNLKGPDPADVLGYAVFIASMLTIGFTRNNKFPALRMLLMCLFVTSALIASVPEIRSYEQTLRLGANVLGAIGMLRWLNKYRLSRRLLLVFSIGTTLASAVAVAMLVGVIPMPEIVFNPGRDFRFMGLSGDPNIQGYLISAATLVFSVEAIESKNTAILRHLYSVLSAITFAIVFATLSRSAILATVAGLSLLSIYSVKKKLNRSLLVHVGIMAVVVVLAILVSTGIIDDAGPIIDQRLTAFGIRGSLFVDDPMEAQRAGFYYTRRALDVAIWSPFGLGAGGLETTLPPIDGRNVGSHNAMVHVLGDLGIVAFGVAFVITAKLLGRTLQNYRTDNNTTRQGLINALPLALLLQLIIVGAFQDLVQWTGAWLVFSCITALCDEVKAGSSADINLKNS